MSPRRSRPCAAGRVCAMPTTLSGAEMTTIHRLPAGRETQAPHLVRPVLVIADPVEMTSLDDRRLRASAMNALAHGAEALYGPLANPVATLSALRGAELIASALDRDPDERDRRRPRARLDPLRQRARLRRLRPASRRLPDARPNPGDPSRGDQRDDAAADDGGDALSGPRRDRVPGHRARHDPREDPVTSPVPFGRPAPAPGPGSGPRAPRGGRATRSSPGPISRPRPIHRIGRSCRRS